MRLSQYPLFTMRETPADAEIISHQLMLRAGMIRRIASGLYTWMPLGLKVLKKIEAIVREEMNATGSLELLMPAIQPAELWQESGRWETNDAEMLRLKDRHERDFCFGPTHEELITHHFRSEIKSYKQLPICFYQVQTKFRDEIRPRFGVMRAREFIMKDAYSFHMDEASLQQTYQVMRQAYERIFDRIGLDYRIVAADSGNMGGNLSEEFHVLADSGEDQLAVSDAGGYAANVEVAGDVTDGDPSPDGQGKLKLIRGIEVGHIFQLGNKYTRSMNASVQGEEGGEVIPEMGCYGIGISRIAAAAIEQSHDNNGMIWPASIAPFQVAILPINANRSDRVKETSEALYDLLVKAGVDVVIDDRDMRPGVMFAEADLIGTPHRVVIGDKSLNRNVLEYKARSAQDSEDIENSVKAVLDKIGG